MNQTVSHEENLLKRKQEYDASLQEYEQATNNYYGPLPLGACYHTYDRSTEERRLNRSRSIARINKERLENAEREMQKHTFVQSMHHRLGQHSMANVLDEDILRHIYSKI
jgi:hypothetical protein